MDITQYTTQLIQNAKQASVALRALSAESRNQVLLRAAQLLRSSQGSILEGNLLDVQQANQQALSKSMVDRLTLNPKRIEDMCVALEEIAAFADPVGKVLESRAMSNGAEISRVTTPIGSVLFIYESRPNVTIDGAALCFKSGNAVVLRGGKESLHSSRILAKLFRQALQDAQLPADAVQLVDNPDRQIVSGLLQQEGGLDLVIPRGGEGLIRMVMEQSRIPVIKHYKGVCHIYVHPSADLSQVSAMLINAKVQRPSACNAMETLLLDSALETSQVNSWLNDLLAHGVQLHGCEKTCAKFTQVKPVTSMDQFHTEYLDLQLSIRMVDNVQQATEHIEIYGSSHTEAILAQDITAQEYFLSKVDSSSVMVNASTRLADGGVYGLGAEVGISTDKLHARGPMGVDSLTTYKWVIRGNGQLRK